MDGFYYGGGGFGGQDSHKVLDNMSGIVFPEKRDESHSVPALIR
jgi:hypothetical protein